MKKIVGSLIAAIVLFCAVSPLFAGGSQAGGRPETKGVFFDIQLETLDWGHSATEIIVDMGTPQAAEGYRFLAPTDVQVLTTHRNPSDNNIVNGVDRVRREVVAVEVDGQYIRLKFSKIFTGVSPSATTHNALTGGNLVIMEYEVTIIDRFNNLNVLKPVQRNVLEDPRAAFFEPVLFDHGGRTWGYHVYKPNSTNMPVILNFGENGNENRNSLFNNMGGFGWYDWSQTHEPAIIIALKSSATGGSDNYVNNADSVSGGTTVKGAGVGGADMAVGGTHVPAVRPSPSAEALVSYIQSLISQGIADPNRIYLSGYSNNGNEVFFLLADYPTLWAAAIPICPHTQVGTARATALARGNPNLPIWMVVDRMDTAQPPQNMITNPNRTQTHYEVVKNSIEDFRAAGMNMNTVYHTVLNGVYDRYGTRYDVFGWTHFAWVTVYNNRNYTFEYPSAHVYNDAPDVRIMDWLFAQKK
jgi:hypothetical protein